VPKAVPKITTICEICGTPFDRTPAFHRSAEAKGGKVRFCGMKCFGMARATGVIAAHCKTGKTTLKCEMCGNAFDVWPSRAKWTARAGSSVRFCSKECHGAARTARVVRMPRWHSESNVKRSIGNRAAWGLPPHPEDVMALGKADRAAVSRGRGFSVTQLKYWKGPACEKCGSTKNLELDHITCMAAGGTSTRDNAQTLCRTCHRWKIKHVDKPLVRQQSQSGGTVQ
jgi:5-methylcytosine-specific restriction endonuclease McrA